MDIQQVVRELDDNISELQDMLLERTRPHPARPIALFYLAYAQFHRYELSDRNDDKDLEQSILYFTEAILLPLHPWDENIANTTEMLFHLASALQLRSRKSRQPHDTHHAIRYLRYLRGQPLDDCEISQIQVMGTLMDVLVFRFELECSEGMRDIEEMIAVCRELLTVDFSAKVTNDALLSLNLGIIACGRAHVTLSDQYIKSIQEASMRWPNSRMLSVVLATSHSFRFFELCVDVDFKVATAILKRLINSWRPKVCLDYEKEVSSVLMTMLATHRSMQNGKPEYVEEAISHFRSPALSDAHHDVQIKSLKVIENRRFECFGVADASALQEALSLNLKIDDPYPAWGLDAPGGDISISASHSKEEVEKSIQHLQDILSTLRPGTIDYRRCLDKIVESYRVKSHLTHDSTDIEEAIKYSRWLLDLFPPNTLLSIDAVACLAELLQLSYECTHKNEDLIESITLLRGALEVPSGQTFGAEITKRLISSLFKHFTSPLGNQDIPNTVQIMDEVFCLAADNGFMSVPSRLECSYTWAWWSRSISHPSIPTAYEKAMSLMQDAVMFAPNLQLQHAHLVAMNRVSQMPLDYASYQVDKGQLEQAIETLERGRALFWSELRGFHNSINQLSSVDPRLAEKWSTVNRDLENLTMSALPNRNTEIGGGGTEDGDGADPFGRLLVKQRKLREEREKIISQVRTLPGFDNFLTAPSFDTLRSAASRGPVIIINHSVYRSDILILLHNSPPSLIPTSKEFYDHANGLKDKLLDARKKSGLNSKEYKHALASVLADLYKLVGQPVIERFHELKIPEQSRIWWCPTSVFCSLPLHAMGPIPSDDGVKRYFLDLYIPSYTSTLSALIESRKPGTQPSNPSLLLVAQPDKSLPGVKGEIEVIQALDIEVESLILQDATTAAVIGGLKRHQLVHFACHGGLETGKPFDASFQLHGDEHLTLLDIVHSRLPAAEVAFLAACHTAELTEESIDDEGLHLAAAVQYCGFRSAVGTMWAMADTDGRDLAHHFYHSMLSRQKEVPCHEKSAKALRNAVRKLRSTKGVTLERWVNFIHYGA